MFRRGEGRYECCADGAERGEDERGNALEGMGDMRCGKDKQIKVYLGHGFSLAPLEDAERREEGRERRDRHVFANFPWAAKTNGKTIMK